MGSVPREQVPSKLSNSSVGLVFPSEWAEVFQTVYAEALAAGSAVVARRGDSAADDMLKSGTAGVYDRFLALGSSPNRAVDGVICLGNATEERFSRRFTPPVWMNGMLDLYEFEVHFTRCP